MSTRKLASGHLLVAPSPKQVMKEKLFFRQQTDKLSQLLESEVRYCPSYKRNVSAHHRILSRVTSSNDSVSLETPFRRNHSRPQTNEESDEIVRQYRDFRCHISPVFSKHTPASKSEKKSHTCHSKTRTKYKSRKEKRSQRQVPDETAKEIDTGNDSMAPNVDTENPLLNFVRDENNEFEGRLDDDKDFESVENKMNAEYQIIRFTNEGEVTSYTHSNKGEPHSDKEHDADFKGEPHSDNGHDADFKGEPHSDNEHDADFKGEPHSDNEHDADFKGDPQSDNEHHADFKGEPHSDNEHHADFKGEPHSDNEHHADFKGEPHSDNEHDADFKGEPHSDNEHHADLKGKRRSYHGIGSSNTNTEINSNPDLTHKHVSRVFERGHRNLFSRQHCPSLNCDIFGPLTCKFCTRHLSIANATLALPAQSLATYSFMDMSCPLCRAEKMSFMRYKAQSASAERQRSISSSASPSHYYYHYTPLELFLRVRNRKQAEISHRETFIGSSTTETGEKPDSNQNQGCLQNEGKAKGNRSPRGGSTPDSEAFRFYSDFKDDCSCDQRSVAEEHSDSLERSKSMSRVSEDCFDGIRITVKYLNHAHSSNADSN